MTVQPITGELIAETRHDEVHDAWSVIVTRADHRIAVTTGFIRAVNADHTAGYAGLYDGYLVIHADNRAIVYRLGDYLERIDSYMAVKVWDGPTPTGHRGSSSASSSVGSSPSTSGATSSE